MGWEDLARAKPGTREAYKARPPRLAGMHCHRPLPWGEMDVTIHHPFFRRRLFPGPSSGRIFSQHFGEPLMESELFAGNWPLGSFLGRPFTFRNAGWIDSGLPEVTLRRCQDARGKGTGWPFIYLLH